MKPQVARIVTKPNKEKAVIMRPAQDNDDFISPVMQYLSDRWSEHEIRDRIHFLTRWRKLSYDNKIAFLSETGFKFKIGDHRDTRNAIDDIDKMSYKVCNFIEHLDSIGVRY